MRAIQSSSRAFAALRCDGRVVAWGSPDFGGDAEAAEVRVLSFFTKRWWVPGIDLLGIDLEGEQNYPQMCLQLMAEFYVVQAMLHGIQAIQGSRVGFAALREDGYVISWGGNSAPQVIDHQRLQRHALNHPN